MFIMFSLYKNFLICLLPVGTLLVPYISSISFLWLGRIRQILLKFWDLGRVNCYMCIFALQVYWDKLISQFLYSYELCTVCQFQKPGSLAVKPAACERSSTNQVWILFLEQCLSSRIVPFSAFIVGYGNRKWTRPKQSYCNDVAPFVVEMRTDQRNSKQNMFWLSMKLSLLKCILKILLSHLQVPCKKRKKKEIVEIFLRSQGSDQAHLCKHL